MKHLHLKKIFQHCVSYALVASQTSCITDQAQSKQELDINFERQYLDIYVEELCSVFESYIDVTDTSISCIDHCETQETTDRLTSCQYVKNEQGLVQVLCTREGSCAIPGRWTRFAGPKPNVIHQSVQQEIIRRMTCEGVAVKAFERLALELKAYDAPLFLMDAIDTAIQDEKRHFQLFQDLAGSLGITQISVDFEIDRYAVRTLLEIGIENAIEGCVGESFAALENLYQSECAQEMKIRVLHQQIVEDEIAHAELSWAIHDWILKQLPAHEQMILKDQLRLAVDQQVYAKQPVLSEEMRRYLGLTDARIYGILVDQLNGLLWQKQLA